MEDSRIARAIVWLLLVCVGHVPVPCFDADWEDQGIPFDSVFDPHGWHTLLLGVAPPDDIDRGPFRDDTDETESPFGAPFFAQAVPGIISLAKSQPSGQDSFDLQALLCNQMAVKASISGLETCYRTKCLRSPRAHCAMLCVMLL